MLAEFCVHTSNVRVDGEKQEKQEIDDHLRDPGRTTGFDTGSRFLELFTAIVIVCPMESKLHDAGPVQKRAGYLQCPSL